MVIKLIPPVAILEAKPPEANMMDNEFPINLHFLKFFNACLWDQHFLSCGNMPSILQSVLLLAYLRYDSNEIYSFVILSYILFIL